VENKGEKRGVGGGRKDIYVIEFMKFFRLLEDQRYSIFAIDCKIIGPLPSGFTITLSMSFMMAAL